MKILLFDMDGVLLDPLGYHKALIETVRLVSRSMGFDDFILSDKDIAQFEALGISSEWDSSALCAALLVIDACQNDQEFRLPTSLSTDLLLQYKRRIELSKLFEALKGQPAELPAALRAQQAIEDIAHKYHVYPKQPSEIIKHSKLIEHSLTLNVFQELVLGSENYERTYQRKKQLSVESYLQKYDKLLLINPFKDKLLRWLEDPQHNATIMTNRPSAIALGKAGTPEAELGAELLGLDSLPIIGSGEIRWLAQKMNAEVGALMKPAPTHALAATFAALGNSLEDSLISAYNLTHSKVSSRIQSLHKSTVYVFEDTVAGIISVESMQKVLKQNNFHIQTHKCGVSRDPIKRSYLKDQGASLFDSINSALGEVL